MKADSLTGLSPVLYIPHGGGPLPLLGDGLHCDMADFLVRITSEIGRPSSILVISAHWEERDAVITGAGRPPLIYDYYGFPEEAYEILYDAPGDPDLARKILALLDHAGIPARIDDHRGFDHGLFVPLTIMYPLADIPCVQLSLNRNLDPAYHIRMGNALSDLRKENILVLGSGFSFHNLGEFFRSDPPVPDKRNDAFQQWLIDACTDAAIPAAERTRRLVEWEKAPAARYCHPREEHLLPLHVCAGFSDIPATCVFDGMVTGKRSVALLW
jgi:4,5-DOPA dioxygenase extradiol